MHIQFTKPSESLSGFFFFIRNVKFKSSFAAMDGLVTATTWRILFSLDVFGHITNKNVHQLQWHTHSPCNNVAIINNLSSFPEILLWLLTIWLPPMMVMMVPFRIRVYLKDIWIQLSTYAISCALFRIIWLFASFQNTGNKTIIYIAYDTKIYTSNNQNEWKLFIPFFT